MQMCNAWLCILWVLKKDFTYGGVISRLRVEILPVTLPSRDNLIVSVLN